MDIKIVGAALCSMVLLSACGDTVGEQALIGAGAGAATAAVLDENILTGAAMGAGGNVLFCQANPHRCN